MPAVANVAPVAAAAADGGTETPATPANEEPASTTADNAALLNKVNAGLEALLTGKGAANQTKKYEDYSEAELGALNEEEFEKVFNEYKTRKDA